MTWDGIEKRKEKWGCPVQCILREDIQQMGKDIIAVQGEIKNLNTRINGSLETINRFMQSGLWWRGSIIAVVIYVIAQAMVYGQQQKQVEVNTRRLDVVETYIHGGTK